MRSVVVGSHLIQAVHFARRVIEFIMVDFDMCERSVELHIDIALPWSEAYGRHGEA
jgi:hypothetical protein